MKRFFTVLVIVSVLLGIFSACTRPNDALGSDSENESDSKKITDKATEDNDGEKDKNETQGNVGDESGKGDQGNINPDGGGETLGKNYIRENNYIYFGEYPQSLKKSDVTIGDTLDSRGYFLGSDNAYYAKVIASPYENGYKFSNDSTVANGSTYYFKVEPIKWRILSESDNNALLLCESIIESRCYDLEANNYKESEIRKWLNDTFYNSAFNQLERALIQAVTVDNSINSTGYSENSNVCENTEDKIFLLSYSDVTNVNYGFTDDISRMRLASDYTLAKGAWISTSKASEHYGHGLWMLRTPNNTYTHFIRECSFSGEVTDGGTNLVNSFFGVVPALKIKL